MVRVHPRSPYKPRLGLYSRFRSWLVPASGTERSVRLRLERVVAVLAQLTHPFGNPHGISGFLGLAGLRSFIRVMTMNWF
jgi:hypothetical protein